MPLPIDVERWLTAEGFRRGPVPVDLTAELAFFRVVPGSTPCAGNVDVGGQQVEAYLYDRSECGGKPDMMEFVVDGTFGLRDRQVRFSASLLVADVPEKAEVVIADLLDAWEHVAALRTATPVLLAGRTTSTVGGDG